ncbi:MAG: polysaccharide biosynthesis/export family protein [Brevundimonas sp.]|uniref:polysaccharide biosynthesis/export family protein n=1 Tax=Brevundimonas sp. TaxID=1871086 RepID=UPI0027726332|nr:polysaccharide biosynthesis/export family protein [Brevundimonas sp.]MDP3400190.1 polysaccharide biosynthesis/export family protein [Brevundimonas sp.]MDZ4109893.1 polysaccharide biosynthesis/export family protein [Brevundimonas sp.]
MNTALRLIALLFAVFALAACGSSGRSSADVSAATSVASYDLPVGQVAAPAEDYRIGETDLLKVSVFRVPELSFDEIRVDASGNIQMPLIGTVQAAGLTPSELSASLTTQLGARYLRNPQITVTVIEAASQKITIDGAVTQPGVYEMRGRTTLLQAVAMARGPTGSADLSSVAVFRTINGQRMVAVFDLGAIRNGAAEDPVVLGEDVIVVDTSTLNAGLRAAISAAPVLTLFRLF